MLSDRWELAASPPGACDGPANTTALEWRPAIVPGTAAGAIGADGRDFDAEDWWFRTTFEAEPANTGERLVLELDGIATVSETYLNGELVLESRSMWAMHELDVTDRIRNHNELAIACRALKPLLRIRRRPAARWRTRVVNEGNLRWFRTMMFGRSPGFAPGPAAVGPWRPVRLARRRRVGVDALRVEPRIEGDDGVVLVRGRLRSAAAAAEVAIGGHRAALEIDADLSVSGEIRVPTADRWWPHTHGEPVLHDLTVEVDGSCVATRAVGFRTLEWADQIAVDGLDLRVNGVPVFVRGAVWTPADLVSMAPTEDQLRALLLRVRDAGMNMLRVVGTGAYESRWFYDLCDELGILVWQDLMFANLDYPLADPEFRAEVEREAGQVLEPLAGRPSLVVVCGNSEVEQQPAIMGLDRDLGRDELWEQRLREIVGDAHAYLPSTPHGGDLPFHANQGVTHYFGVSGYFRPPADARRAEVRFAAECLAFANVPERVEFPVHHPSWKQGVPRDAGTGWGLGAGWDFDDVRDFYLELLFGVDPVQLRRSDHERYLELSRVSSGEVMAEVMGEWRRDSSPCRGALVLWLKDMLPGAGLGVIDSAGEPKVAYHYLRRALAPVAVWMTDEGVNGVAIHVANDSAEPVAATLRLGLYRDHEVCVAEAQESLELEPHGVAERTVEGLLKRFADAAWAYRFGPPAQDLIVATLEGKIEGTAISQSFWFPSGRPTGRESAERMGIETFAHPRADGTVELTLTSRRLAYGVRIRTPGFNPADDAFSIEPGGRRLIALYPETDTKDFGGGTVTALNLAEPVRIAPVESRGPVG